MYVFEVREVSLKSEGEKLEKGRNKRGTETENKGSERRASGPLFEGRVTFAIQVEKTPYKKDLGN